MSIIASTEDLKKHVSVAESLVFADYQPYVTKAINKFTYKYVGDLHTFLADEAAPESENATIKNTARGHLAAAIANFAMFQYIPLAQLQFDSSGITTSQNDRRKNAEWWQIADVRRDFLSSGHDAMDILLAYLETNKSVFPDWATDYSTINKELLVSCTADFDRYYNIFASRQTYLALQPSIRAVEDQFIKTFLCPELIQHLLTGTLTEATHKSVRENLQKAIVAFTVAKVCDEGMFLLDASGLKLKYDLLPQETGKVPDYGKQADQVTRTAQKQTDNGVTYLQMARKTIEANLNLFDQCTVVFINDASEGSQFVPYNTKGVLGL